ncbi:MAG: V-type ATP synthase subunit E [Planctomycetota bacterium]|nr:MAG: V-type ATP synthase subunit E [Planctomycetota bacterium]
MEAEQVIEKILANAKAEADKIKSKAEKIQAQEQAKLKEELTEYKKQSEILAQKAAKDKYAHLLAAARMDLAKKFLAEKRKILDDLFNQARQQLQNLPDGEYRSFMTKLMLDAVETGDEEVIIDGGEKRIDHEFIKQINRQLGPSYKHNLILSKEKVNLGGGFILKRGKIKNNLSFNVLLARARRELEIVLAKELFEN